MIVADELTVGGFHAAAGSKITGSVPVDLGEMVVDVPVILVNGERPGPRVVITAGVHGGEFVGVDAATRLGRALDPEAISGQVVVCPVANPPAVYHGRLGVSPLDGVNINRVFPGDPAGGPTERLAAWLFTNVITHADAYADLHSGGIDEVLRDFVAYRITGDSDVDAKTRDIAHALGITDVIVGPDAGGGNSHAAAARLGIPAVLVETGQLGERDPATTRALLVGLYRLLRHLGVLDQPDETEPITSPEPGREWLWAGSVTADVAGLWYPQFTLGEDVVAGEVIGSIIDPLGGHEHKVVATASGRLFFGMQGLTVAHGAELAAIAGPLDRETA